MQARGAASPPPQPRIPQGSVRRGTTFVPRHSYGRDIAASSGDVHGMRLAYSAAPPTCVGHPKTGTTEERRPPRQGLCPDHRVLSRWSPPGLSGMVALIVSAPLRRAFFSDPPSCLCRVRRPPPPSARPMRDVPGERRQGSCRFVSAAPSGRLPSDQLD